MKKSIYVLMVVIASTISYSQDYEPAQTWFYWGVGGDTTYLSTDMDYFKQNKFLLGWQWGGTPQMKRAMKMNASAEGYAHHDADNEPIMPLRIKSVIQTLAKLTE